MDQDELEDEIFTKTIGVHLSMFTDYIKSYSFDFNGVLMISHRREFFMYLISVIVAISAWLIHSGLLSKRFESIDFISKSIGSLGNKVWQETEKCGSSSAYSLQGRRPTMEDRFVLTESVPPVIVQTTTQTKESDSFKDLLHRQTIKIYGVFDGHGGEFAATFVHRHLVNNLSMKIRLLQLLLQEKFVNKEKLLKEYERISKSPAMPDVLKYLGINQSSDRTSKVNVPGSKDRENYGSIDLSKNASSKSESSLNNNTKPTNSNPLLAVNGLEEKDKPSSEIKPTLVLSSRVKPIEELPIPENLSNILQENKEDISNANFIYSDLLSPYNDQAITATKQRNSPLRLGQNGCSSTKNKSVNQDISCKRNLKEAVQNEHNNTTSSKKSNTPPNNVSTNGVVTFKRDITEYLFTNKSNGDIDFPKLIRDEIANVDQLLIQEAKKSMQIGGTTVLLAILDCSSSILWVANVGDSRGVLCNSSKVPLGEVMPLSYDHKPSQLKERKRIEDAGGFIAMNGVWRVQGILATSRAMGDFPLKDKKVVTCEPDILSFRLKKLDSEFAILASDGLWDTHSNEEAVQFIKSSLNENNKTSRTQQIENAAKNLAIDSHRKGSTDNVTVVLLDFKNI